jgi:hypothetical protein
VGSVDSFNTSRGIKNLVGKDEGAIRTCHIKNKKSELHVNLKALLSLEHFMLDYMLVCNKHKKEEKIIIFQYACMPVPLLYLLSFSSWSGDDT